MIDLGSKPPRPLAERQAASSTHPDSRELLSCLAHATSS
jgi:hypothetical protein